MKTKKAATLTITILIIGSIGFLITSRIVTEEDKELKINKFTFIQGEFPHNLQKHVERPNTYRSRDLVLIYFEVKGYNERKNIVDIKQTLTVTNPKGNTYINRTITDKPISTARRNYLWFKEHIVPPAQGFTEGEHIIKIKIRDKLTNETTEYTETFTVKQPLKQA